jgi:hypothetical protein
MKSFNPFRDQEKFVRAARMKQFNPISLHNFVSEIHNYDHLRLGRTVLMFGDQSGAIICCPPTPKMALDLSMGLFNSDIRWLPTQSLESFDLNNPNMHYQWLGLKKHLQLIPERFIPPGLQETRTVAIERLHALFVLDILARMSQPSAFSKMHDDTFVSIISTELAKCIPDKNMYTEAIQEWAAIQEIPVENAYKELMLRYDDIALICVRNQSIYDKHVRLINQTSGLDNLQIVLDSAGYELSMRGGI